MNEVRAAKIRELVGLLRVEWSPLVRDALGSMPDDELDEFYTACSSLNADQLGYVSYELLAASTAEHFSYQTGFCLAVIAPVMEAVSPGEIERQQISASEVNAVLEYMDLRLQSGRTNREALSARDRVRMMRGSYLRLHATGDLFENTATDDDLLWLGDNYPLVVSVLDELMARRTCTPELVRELLDHPSRPIRGGSL